MPRGKKTSPETIYKVMTSWAIHHNNMEVSRELGIPEATVRKIVDMNKDKEEFTKLCDEKKKDFADKATEIIDKGLELINRRLTVALDKQAKLDKLIDEVLSTDDEEMSYKDKMTAVNLIRETQIQKIKDISTAVGTLYDKRALARGETTQNIDFATNFDINKLIDIAGYRKKGDDD